MEALCCFRKNLLQIWAGFGLNPSYCDQTDSALSLSIESLFTTAPGLQVPMAVNDIELNTAYSGTTSGQSMKRIAWFARSAMCLPAMRLWCKYPECGKAGALPCYLRPWHCRCSWNWRTSRLQGHEAAYTWSPAVPSPDVASKPREWGWVSPTAVAMASSKPLPACCRIPRQRHMNSVRSRISSLSHSYGCPSACYC